MVGGREGGGRGEQAVKVKKGVGGGWEVKVEGAVEICCVESGRVAKIV